MSIGDRFLIYIGENYVLGLCLLVGFGRIGTERYVVVCLDREQFFIRTS